jgi:hypothetical protein
MTDYIKQLESKVRDCNNTNTIFDTRKYVLLEDAKEVLNQALNIPVVMQSCDTCKHLSTCRFWQEAPNNGATCKFYIEHVA